MSRAYSIELSSSVEQTVCADDVDIQKIDMEDVHADMREINEEVLKERGWTAVEGLEGCYETEIEGVRVVWDLEANEVQSKVEASETLEKEFSVNESAWNRKSAKDRAKKALAAEEKRVEDSFASDQKALEESVTEILENSREARKQEVHEVLQRTYSEAVRKKARELGEVVSEFEDNDGEEYSLSIVIEA